MLSSAVNSQIVGHGKSAGNRVAVLNGGERRAAHLRWGLIPSWAKDSSVGNRLINARAETVAERNSFR